jgi:hypothetical protein
VQHLVVNGGTRWILVNKRWILVGKNADLYKNLKIAFMASAVKLLPPSLEIFANRYRNVFARTGVALW